MQADRHAWDFAVPFVGHGVSADAPIVPQDLGVGPRVTTLQEGNVGLTHCDVLWRCVGVQFLMPGLQELALYALKKKVGSCKLLPAMEAARRPNAGGSIKIQLQTRSTSPSCLGEALTMTAVPHECLRSCASSSLACNECEGSGEGLPALVQIAGEA